MNWISPSSLLVSAQTPHKHTHVCAHTCIHALHLIVQSLPFTLIACNLSCSDPYLQGKCTSKSIQLLFSIKELYMSVPVILQQLFKHQFFIFLYSWTCIRYSIEEEKKIFDRILNISRNKLIQFLKNKNHIWFSPSVPDQCSVFDIYFLNKWI